MSRAPAYRSGALSMRQISLNLPLDDRQISDLAAGDKILLSGEIYSARDQAHKRLIQILNNHQPMPIDLAKTAIFYCGPSPRRPGQICGAIGPTTSYRMDALTEPLLHEGLKVMIGKGERSPEIGKLIREYGAVYLTTFGGISAVLSRCIVSCETFLWPELGAEAVYRMVVDKLPCYVAIK